MQDATLSDMDVLNETSTELSSDLVESDYAASAVGAAVESKSFDAQNDAELPTTLETVSDAEGADASRLVEPLSVPLSEDLNSYVGDVAPPELHPTGVQTVLSLEGTAAAEYYEDFRAAVLEFPSWSVSLQSTTITNSTVDTFPEVLDSPGLFICATRAMLVIAGGVAAEANRRFELFRETRFAWAYLMAGLLGFLSLFAGCWLVAARLTLSSVGFAVSEDTSLQTAPEDCDVDSPDSKHTPWALARPVSSNGSIPREPNKSASKVFLEALATPLAMLSPSTWQPALCEEMGEAECTVEETDGRDGQALVIDSFDVHVADANLETPGERLESEGSMRSLSSFQTPRTLQLPSSTASVASMATSRSKRRRRVSGALPIKCLSTASFGRTFGCTDGWRHVAFDPHRGAPYSFQAFGSTCIQSELVIKLLPKSPDMHYV
jgi:hypothetical protein